MPMPRPLAGLPRYRVARIAVAEASDRAREALRSGRRVLWVVNQVRRAQEAARALAQNFPAREIYAAGGVPLYCYHSRLRLEDRRARHRQVVAAFQGRTGPALAVTTQVCEMSLDLDADLLVAEQAPVTSLIQRMGRCNRQPRPAAGRTAVDVDLHAAGAARSLSQSPGFLQGRSRHRAVKCAADLLVVVQHDRGGTLIETAPVTTRSRHRDQAH